MDMPRNAFKHAIANGQLQIGLWCSMCNPIAAEIVSLPKLSTIAIVTPVPSKPCAYNGLTLYAARVDAGVKQRRPTEKHCPSVGGVSEAVTCA